MIPFGPCKFCASSHSRCSSNTSNWTAMLALLPDTRLVNQKQKPKMGKNENEKWKMKTKMKITKMKSLFIPLSNEPDTNWTIQLVFVLVSSTCRANEISCFSLTNRFSYILCVELWMVEPIQFRRKSFSNNFHIFLYFCFLWRRFCFPSFFFSQWKEDKFCICTMHKCQECGMSIDFIIHWHHCQCGTLFHPYTL